MEKRTMKGGFADSPLRLNRDLGKLQKWSDKEISDRAEILADLALEIWNFPSISQETIDRFRELASEDSSQYSIEQFEHLEGENLSIFTELRRRILNLDSSVREEYKKHYIAYKTTTNFVDIRPMKSELLVWINMEFDEVGDEKMWCRDVSEIGHYGNGDVEFRISSFSDINYCIYLVKQSFEKHTDYIAI
jgi:predicted transport protein